MSVLCLGLLTADITQEVASFPRPNQKMAAERTDFDFGGPAANAAATAAALGSRAALWTVLGEGVLDKGVTSLVCESGVAVRNLAAPGARASVQVPISAVIITRGTANRSVVSSHALVAQVPTQISSGPDATVVLLDGHYLEAALSVARRAKAEGTPVIFDGGSWKPGSELLLPLLDVAILSADFHVPDAHRDVLARVPFVARTGGAGPVSLRTPGGEQVSLPVPKVPEADTLGAGDVLHGAFAHYLAQEHLAHEKAERRLTFESVATCLRDAIEVASYSCQFRGAKGWISAGRSGPWSR